MSVTKEKYLAFVENHYVPIFFRPYYLDAVCDVSWDAVIQENNNQIIAAYIFMLKRKFGISYIVQPQLCPYTGPLFFSNSSPTLYSDLLTKLPNHQLLIQDFFHSDQNVSDDAHTRSEKHTWIIKSGTDVDQLWNKQSTKHRSIIKKAESALNLEESNDVNKFLEFVESTFKKRGKQIPHSNVVFKKLDEALSIRGKRKIVKCTNNENVTVAMCYFIRDEKWTYNFANGVIDDYRHYGMNLILWNEIKIALSESRSFDFEGSMIPGVNAFFKRFKGEKLHYPTRFKSKNLFTTLLIKLKGIKRYG